MIQFNPHIPKIEGAYIVGGSIRDILLGHPPVDYDIAVTENPEKFASKIAAAIDGRLITIGKPKQRIFRVVSGKNIFDVASVNGFSIEEDLKQRDFTINALAYSLSSGEIIDIVGGRKDLTEKKVRMVSKNAFRNDPIRLLRAYRLGAILDFNIEPLTASAIKKNADLIQKSAGERIRFELLSMLGAPTSYYYLNEMAKTGLLFALLSEMSSLKKRCFNDLFNHTLATYHHLESLINEIEMFLPDFSNQFHSLIDINRIAPLKWGFLLHDIGKPAVQKINKEEDIRYFHHAKKSAEIAKKICDRFRFSNREKSFVDFIIRNHVRPLSLYMSRQHNKFKPNRLTRFFMNCGHYTPYLLLHSLADVKGNEIIRETEAYQEFVKSVFEAYSSIYRPMMLKPPLITGNDLIHEFGLTPSPLFKKILTQIEEARLNRRINNKASALKLVKQFLGI